MTKVTKTSESQRITCPDILNIISKMSGVTILETPIKDWLKIKNYECETCKIKHQFGYISLVTTEIKKEHVHMCYECFAIYQQEIDEYNADMEEFAMYDPNEEYDEYMQNMIYDTYRDYLMAKFR